ncbi:hypothetical protein ACJX0J_031667 [Zea mays]
MHRETMNLRQETITQENVTLMNIFNEYRKCRVIFRYQTKLKIEYIRTFVVFAFKSTIASMYSGLLKSFFANSTIFLCMDAGSLAASDRSDYYSRIIVDVT